MVTLRVRVAAIKVRVAPVGRVTLLTLFSKFAGNTSLITKSLASSFPIFLNFIS